MDESDQQAAAALADIDKDDIEKPVGLDELPLDPTVAAARVDKPPTIASLLQNA